MIFFFIFVFFKQKTAYEIVSRDWSSDVCSSDLGTLEAFDGLPQPFGRAARDEVAAGLVELLRLVLLGAARGMNRAGVRGVNAAGGRRVARRRRPRRARATPVARCGRVLRPEQQFVKARVAAQGV